VISVSATSIAASATGLLLPALWSAGRQSQGETWTAPARSLSLQRHANGVFYRVLIVSLSL